MAKWQPITNLRNTIQHHPPVVVFFLCLLVLSVTLISVGLYSQNHEMKNPDINMDWNQMLKSFSSLKFCTQFNDTELLNGKQDIISPPLLDHGHEFITNTSQKTTEVISVFMLAPLLCVGDYPTYNSISSTLLGSQLGLKGAAGKQTLNISLFLDQQTQKTSTDSESAQKMPTDAKTKHQSMISCLKITAPRYILPQTPSPPECPAYEKLEKDASSARAVAIESNKPSSKNAPCLSLEFTSDPKLTVLLTQEEKGLARHHLILVSIVLLTLCILICLSGSLTSTRSHYHPAIDLQKETLLGP
ncbi:transmembrane protein 248 [Trichomycterus rosablanca]|uniref:transmembrane protein 248 n=1 Tax=Trichomycterus rosablanca TaxID=2290929 RepID=UPI002F351C75